MWLLLFVLFCYFFHFCLVAAMFQGLEIHWLSQSGSAHQLALHNTSSFFVPEIQILGVKLTITEVLQTREFAAGIYCFSIWPETTGLELGHLS